MRGNFFVFCVVRRRSLSASRNWAAFSKSSRGAAFFICSSKFPLHFVGLAVQKIAGGHDLLPIILARDVADARRGAVFEMAVEAMLVILLARRERAAAAQIEFAPRQRQRVARRGGMRERPEVTRAVVLLQAREHEARDRDR